MSTSAHAPCANKLFSFVSVSEFPFLELVLSNRYETGPEPIRVKQDYDLVVAGGGPSGLMAALAAAERGLRVLVAEQMPRPGRPRIADAHRSLPRRSESVRPPARCRTRQAPLEQCPQTP